MLVNFKAYNIQMIIFQKNIRLSKYNWRSYFKVYLLRQLGEKMRTCSNTSIQEALDSAHRWLRSQNCRRIISTWLKQLWRIEVKEGGGTSSSILKHLERLLGDLREMGQIFILALVASLSLTPLSLCCESSCKTPLSLILGQILIICRL